MTDFLTFLNTADSKTLTKIPGVSRTIAGNIIAARPFEFVEDCSKVQRVGKNLLGQMQSFFETEINDSPTRGMIPAGEAYLTSAAPAHESDKEKPSFSTRLGFAFGNFMRALLRLVLIILIIGGIGAGIYYGLPIMANSFIAPLERNTARVNVLEGQITSMQTQLNQLNSRVKAVESSAASQTTTLQRLQELQTKIQSDLGQNNDKILLELKHEVMMTRALEMLGRARLYLVQSNFGLAKQDVQNARDLLTQLQSETQAEPLAQVISRLDLTLGNLPAFPVVASADLEIAWQLLITGAPANITSEAPDPQPTYTPILDALPPLTQTPLPVTTITPSVTP